MHPILKKHYKTIGSKGGKTASANMTAEERKARSKNALEARWKNKTKNAKIDIENID